MHDIAGLVALAVMGLWIAYLVPHRLRYRQQLLESRAEDRFSGGLRVLVVADARRRDVRTADARAECGPDSPKRSGLLSPARGVPVGRPVTTEGRGGVVERPYGTQDRISAEDARRAAQLRARRAAALARRGAAARRRALLTAVLLVATVVAWVVVGLTALAVVAAVVPTVLLAGVLVLGRRAAVQGRAADAAWERAQRAAARRRTPGARVARVTGRAQHPSDSHTEVIAQVAAGSRTARTAAAPSAEAAPTATAVDDADRSRAVASPVADAAPTPATDTPTGRPTGGPTDTATDTDAPAETSQAEAGDDAATSSESGAGWSPVPVPRPTYTTKATAPRREPLPLVVEEVAPAAAVAADDVSARTSAEDADAPAVPPLDLDAILARRRAAGE
ncbi:hypothetical protein [uncultured Cellulomonas sp.]|uniref:hypothetical protein n=1 Tax=uncultured Cellulomonas sp. TaxID=189682 RepID=UPI00260D08C4|nr:hypothetical protein [uncultured Cellulomonas sp.]